MKQFEKKIEKKLVNSKFTRKAQKLLVGGTVVYNLISMTVFAAGGISAITKPLDTLKAVLIAVVASAGVIILIKNVMETAQAYQQQDTSAMNAGIKGIVAGSMMAGISAILTILGF